MSKGLSKRSIYVLLPIVIVIWGLIVYKVLDITGSPEEISLTVPLRDELSTQEQSARETLSLSYPDPFGLEKPKVVKPHRNRNRTTRRDRSVTQWPELKYNGRVTAKNTNRQISIITINDRQHFFVLEQQHEEVKLLQAWKDSARVSYQDSLIKVIHK